MKSLLGIFAHSTVLMRPACRKIDKLFQQMLFKKFWWKTKSYRWNWLKDEASSVSTKDVHRGWQCAAAAPLWFQENVSTVLGRDIGFQENRCRTTATPLGYRNDMLPLRCHPATTKSFPAPLPRRNIFENTCRCRATIAVVTQISHKEA